MIRPASSTILSEMERVRREVGLTQQALSRRLEISQAHYSKVSAGLVPLSAKLEKRIREFLASGELPPPKTRSAELAEIEALSESIRRDTRQLLARLRELRRT